MQRGIAVLAAGASRRLGQPKQLVVVDGRPLVQRTARVAAAVGCEGVAVILGCEADRIRAALGDVACEPLLNAAWNEGMASSIRVAAGWAELRGYAALMLLVCDQVRLGREHLLQLWAAWSADRSRPVASTYGEIRGIPAVFPRADYTSLLSLQGDRGAAGLLRAREVTQVAWPDGACDLDTPEDLRRL
jgi:CTP:molybdopterin cytidylyltransferase MocA